MATGFLNLDDHDVMMFSDEEAGGIPTQQHWAQDEPDVDWDWATQAHPSGKAMSAPDSGFLNCWRDGPQPDVLDLNDDGDYGFSRGTGVSFPGSLGTTESSDDEMDDVSTPPIASSVPNSSVSRRWTQQETEALRAGIAEFGHGSWHLIQADPRWASLLAGRRRSSMIRKWARMNKTRGTSDSGTNAPSTPSAPSHVGDFASDRDRRILAQAVAQAAAQPLHSLHQPPQPVHRVPGNDWTPEELVALRNAIVRHKGSWESAWRDEMFKALFSRRNRTALLSKWAELSSPLAVSYRSVSTPVAIAQPVRQDQMRRMQTPPPTPSSFPAEGMNGMSPRYGMTPPMGRMAGVPNRRECHLAICVDDWNQPRPVPLRSAPIHANSGPSFCDPRLSSPAIASMSAPKERIPILEQGVEEASTAARSRRWTAEETQGLIDAVSVHGESKWTDILKDAKFSSFFAGRSQQSLPRKWARLNRMAAAKTTQPGSRPSSLPTSWMDHPQNVCEARGAGMESVPEMSSSTNST
ncbi:hypothetical protein PBRA_004620 [Plasmodiophora brassicae]|uniref:Myb-like domain-containing protein n=1 Tax=Plasmodiophora brassicae TaxID=37360 RepID=A0A0G4ILE5_PLABS|nr:hypothetical protein PBRA_004620 [Plasmodiophora brassicae]